MRSRKASPCMVPRPPSRTRSVPSPPAPLTVASSASMSIPAFASRYTKRPSSIRSRPINGISARSSGAATSVATFTPKVQLPSPSARRSNATTGFTNLISGSTVRPRSNSRRSTTTSARSKLMSSFSRPQSAFAIRKSSITNRGVSDHSPSSRPLITVCRPVAAVMKLWAGLRSQFQSNRAAATTRASTNTAKPPAAQCHHGRRGGFFPQFWCFPPGIRRDHGNLQLDNQTSGMSLEFRGKSADTELLTRV
jgi:hypothetical protein